VRLFNLKEDPQEQNDIAETNPEKRDEMLRALSIIQDQMLKPDYFTSGNIQAPPPMSPTLIEELQAGGYMGENTTRP